MIILGLDTTGPDCSACLIRGEEDLAYRSERIGRGHAEHLAPMVADILTEADVAPSDIDRIAVCTGPGSFTGLRVALSFAKGFALPRRLPVLGFDALHVMAHQLLADGDGADVTVFRDVKRGEVFAARFRNGAADAPPQAMSMDHAQALSGDSFYPAETVDVRVMARMAMDANPADHVAEPLYSRGPDAKLPGGVTP